MKISLMLGLLACLFFVNDVCAQIGFSGPTNVVPSGTIVTFTATGETSTKYIGSVPTSGDAS